MRMIEFYSGSRRMSKAFEKKGYKVLSIDLNEEFIPDVVLNMNFFDLSLIPEDFRSPDVVWCSPPCTSFSVASIGRHWNKGKPSEEARNSIKLISKTLEAIMVLRPKYWFIENPRGMLRTLPIMRDLPFKTITYCKYGEERMKPTDVWTNCEEWDARTPCKNGDKCHVSAPRGSRTGTQGLKNNYERSKLPYQLCEEIAGINYEK